MEIMRAQQDLTPAQDAFFTEWFESTDASAAVPFGLGFPASGMYLQNADTGEKGVWAADLRVTQTDGDYVLLNLLVTHPRGSGFGSHAMETITELADKHRVILRGNIESQTLWGEDVMDEDALKRWYEGYGFRTFQHPDTGDKWLMERDPR
jgi:GNAT superfamily N-acetyltransferase